MCPGECTATVCRCKKYSENSQNLEQFICSAPQDISAVCLLVRAKVIHNSSSPEDEAKGAPFE